MYVVIDDRPAGNTRSRVHKRSAPPKRELRHLWVNKTMSAAIKTLRIREQMIVTLREKEGELVEFRLVSRASYPGGCSLPSQVIDARLRGHTGTFTKMSLVRPNLR